MKTMFPVLLAAIIAVGAPRAQAQQVEDTRNLGHGYKMVTIAKPTASSFESISHFAYLYYQDERLCSPSAYSISPSGTYAAWLNEKGDLMLFRRADEKIFPLLPKPAKPVNDFEWNEKEHFVLIHFEKTAQPLKYKLP